SGTAPEALDYTLFDGSFVIGGLESGSVFFLQSHNLVASDTISTDELRSSGALRLGLTGSGTTLGMWEVGDPLLTHTEFTDGASNVRIVDVDGPRADGNTADRWHATHVAGTLIARGANANALGMSPEATLNAYDTLDQFTDIAGIFSNVDASDDICISNHSYGRIAGWWTTYTHTDGITYPVWAGNLSVSTSEDYRFGYYDTNANLIDQITYLQQTYLPVWSAGNDRLQPNASNAGTIYVGYIGEIGEVPPTFINGPYPAADGSPTGYDTLTSYGVAKNVLTVAAANDIAGGWVDAGDVKFANFSSAGPTDDGRIKPDVTANGVGVLSADDPNTSPINTTDDYFSYNGTSQAAPNVAGSSNLLLELHSRLWGASATALASTVKALVIHTADEAGVSPGPDYRGGWGLMNSARAASLIRANYEAVGTPYIHESQVSTGGSWMLPVTALGGQPIKATVVWTDPAGTVVAAALDSPALKLVNDLDLRITGPGGTTLPWILDPANPANAATRGDNTRDNVEQVVVDSPVAGGAYTVTLAPTAGETLLNETGLPAPQPFTVIITGIDAEHGNPAVCLIPTSTTTYELEWVPLPGVSYDLETSIDLQAWTSLQTSVSFDNAPIFTPVTRSPVEPKRFWRFKETN
ncbi:S8 family serine peptidase, partial [Akkermansiaceae bacterium]|nr:S8 family serine peptidase [Akkermansiaceae bacterium]